MIELAFSVRGARAEPHAAVPTLIFRVRIAEAIGRAVDSILRAAARGDGRVSPS